MSEKILAIQRVNRGALLGRTIGEILFFTTDRVIVARVGSEGSGIGVLFGAVGAAVEAAIAARKQKEKRNFFEIAEEGKFFELHPEDILKSDKNNYAIPNSEITKVERKGLKFHIKAGKKTHKWNAGVVISDEMMAKGDNPYIAVEEWRDRDLRKRFEARIWEDYEKVLRPIFGDRLFVKK